MKKLIFLILGIILGLIISKFVFNNQNDLETMTKPKGVITPAEAKKLDQDYNSRHQLISTDITGTPDNRSCWWSINDMQNYLDMIRTEAPTLGYKLDGVRMYLGAHGEKGLTTIFMVPTTSDPLKSEDGGSSKDGDPKPNPPYDIPGGSPMNAGADGNPPSTNYPNQ